MNDPQPSTHGTRFTGPRRIFVSTAFLFQIRSKLFRSLSDDFLFRLYKCSQFAAEYTSARNTADGLWIADLTQ
jgi:hypothetical protein